MARAGDGVLQRRDEQPVQLMALSVALRYCRVAATQETTPLIDFDVDRRSGAEIEPVWIAGLAQHHRRVMGRLPRILLTRSHRIEHAVSDQFDQRSIQR